MGVALAGCSASPPPVVPPGLTVAVVQQRGDIAPGRVQLRVDNGSGEAVTIAAATLTAPALASPAAWDARRTETLAPGRIVDLPVMLPALRCRPGDGAIRVTLETTIGGISGTSELDADDPLGILARLSAAQCDRDDLAAVAEVAATAASPRGDGTADLTISITPTGGDGEPIELEAMRGTPLLHFAEGEEAVLATTVSPGDAPSTLTVAVTPRRCDPHAIAEDKVGTLFDLVARVDGREVVVSLPRPQAVADDLLAFTAAACGLAP
ncbi:MAG: hypothetical protein BGO45_03350 [Microbacterium sp. 71-36]|uniref:hypothetical protein n=1 Tax=unclassified Microbacterium TaxID=2609290 RepID=UPI00086A9010|nr:MULTISPECIES: hypothetical protein [unclassified Microbacterium]MBN9210018.1 hypothetical protein [Microbacterium sp.]ODT39027.1 MAG: hypothetical protein ABS60_08265 [Microbacterium sp. SCN 71-17]OJV74812.1 MAG: hypothetical protein BGO45_03350 [Microbacterium sp. 71-36]